MDVVELCSARRVVWQVEVGYANRGAVLVTRSARDQGGLSQNVEQLIRKEDF